MATLHDPIRIGDWELPNRVIMAPLTRCRASEGRVPNDLMRQYYQQRAGAGLIISEATSISPMGGGYPNTPGIWSQEQIAGWKRVTDGVHSAGGQILLQPWHVGRVSSARRRRRDIQALHRRFMVVHPLTQRSQELLTPCSRLQTANRSAVVDRVAACRDIGARAQLITTKHCPAQRAGSNNRFPN